MQRTYTRRELYDLVWSTPIVKVAEDFGLSDRGLAKLCQRHLIPVPWRGYWARIEAGQTVTKTPLRPMHSPEPFACDGPVEKGLYLLVDLLAKPGDLAFGDATHAHGLHQVVN